MRKKSSFPTGHPWVQLHLSRFSHVAWSSKLRVWQVVTHCYCNLLVLFLYFTCLFVKMSVCRILRVFRNVGPTAVLVCYSTLSRWRLLRQRVLPHLLCAVMNAEKLNNKEESEWEKQKLIDLLHAVKVGMH